jgi:hypothetical protein
MWFIVGGAKTLVRSNLDGHKDLEPYVHSSRVVVCMVLFKAELNLSHSVVRSVLL